MKNVSIQISQSFETLTEDYEALSSLYDWLGDSPNGTNDDLQALDNAIDIFTKILRQLEREVNDGF